MNTGTECHSAVDTASGHDNISPLIQRLRYRKRAEIGVGTDDGLAGRCRQAWLTSRGSSPKAGDVGTQTWRTRPDGGGTGATAARETYHNQCLKEAIIGARERLAERGVNVYIDERDSRYRPPR